MADYDFEYLELLKSSTKGTDLTVSESRSLEWLAGWDQSTVTNIASIIRKSREVERSQAAGFTQKELLTIWGCLQCLKDIYEGKARESVARPDVMGAKLAGDWMKMAAEIVPLQEKINKEAKKCG